MRQRNVLTEPARMTQQQQVLHKEWTKQSIKRQVTGCVSVWRILGREEAERKTRLRKEEETRMQRA